MNSVEVSDAKPSGGIPGQLWPLALYIYGSAVLFWLWANWLFSPQMFFLPPLPPVEVLISLVERTLGPWLVTLVTLSSLLLIALDAWRSRSGPRPGWWWRSLLFGAAATVAIHVMVWVAGTLLFFSIMALLPGSEVHTLSTSDPVVRGLVLFTTFLSLLMSGPITALIIAARELARRRRDAFPACFFATLNHAVAILLVPLSVLWVLSGHPRETLQALSGPTSEVRSEDLLVAAREGDLAQVRSLLGQGAAVDGHDRSGATPLIVASANGHLEIVQALTAAKADTNLRDASGRTALMAAAANRQARIADALIAAQADVQAQDAEGKTALTLAVLAREPEIVRALVRAGANLNTATASGETALMIASRGGDAEVVRALLEAGADANARDKEGHTAIEIARRFGHKDVAAILAPRAKR